MKIEEKITKMKKVYLGTSVSDDEVIQEWQVLENVLGKQQKTYVSPLFFRTFAFAAVVLVFTGGVVTLAQASKPGELLYPVKEFSQEVVQEVKKSVPVFMHSKPVQPEGAEEEQVKGATDQNKENNNEKGKDTNASDVKGQSSEQKGQNVETGNDDNNNSGPGNSSKRNKFEGNKKGSTTTSKSEKK